jgi:hypothetical protein
MSRFITPFSRLYDRLRVSPRRTLRVHAASALFPIACVCISLAADSLAGAWVKPQGGYYFKISTSYFETTEEYNFLGDQQEIFAENALTSNTSFRDFSITTYLEYGLFDALTLVGTVPFKILTSKESELLAPGFPSRRITRTNGGLGDLRVALRTPIIRRPVVLSVQGGVKIPLGYEKEPDNDGPPLGTGDVDGELHILYGQSLYPVPAYIAASAGYRLRGGTLNDEWVYTAEAGYTLGPVFAKLSFDVLRNTEDPPDIAGATVINPLPGGGGAVPEIIVGDQDVSKISPSLSYAVSGSLSLTAEAFHVLGGKNTVAGTTFSLGLVYER